MAYTQELDLGVSADGLRGALERGCPGLRYKTQVRDAGGYAYSVNGRAFEIWFRNLN